MSGLEGLGLLAIVVVGLGALYWWTKRDERELLKACEERAAQMLEPGFERLRDAEQAALAEALAEHYARSSEPVFAYRATMHPSGAFHVDLTTPSSIAAEADSIAQAGA